MGIKFVSIVYVSAAKNKQQKTKKTKKTLLTIKFNYRSVYSKLLKKNLNSYLSAPSKKIPSQDVP